MKIKDIVRILSAVDGEHELYVEVGRSGEERAGLGLLEYEKGECLNYLYVDEISASDCPSDEGMIVRAILRHDNWAIDVVSEYREKGYKKLHNED